MFFLFTVFFFCAINSMYCALASEPSLFDRFRALPHGLQTKILNFCDEPVKKIVMEMPRDKKYGNFIGTLALNRSLSSLENFGLPEQKDGESYGVKAVNLLFGYVELCLDDHTLIRHRFEKEGIKNGVSFDGNNVNNYGVLVRATQKDGIYTAELWLWDARNKKLKFLTESRYGNTQISNPICMMHKERNRIAYTVWLSAEEGLKSSLHIVDFDEDTSEKEGWRVREVAAQQCKAIYDQVHVGNDIYFGARREGLIRMQLQSDYTFRCEQLKMPCFGTPFARIPFKLAVDESSKMQHGIRSALACCTFLKKEFRIYTIDLDEGGNQKRVLLNNEWAQARPTQIFYDRGMLATWEEVPFNKPTLTVWPAHKNSGVHELKTLLAQDSVSEVHDQNG